MRRLKTFPFQLSHQAFWIHHMDPHNSLQGTHKVNGSKEGKTESDRGNVNSFAKRSSLVIKFQAKSPVYYGFSFTSCLNMHKFILHEQAHCLHLRCHTQFPSEREKKYHVKRMPPRRRECNVMIFLFFTGLNYKSTFNSKRDSLFGVHILHMHELCKVLPGGEQHFSRKSTTICITKNINSYLAIDQIDLSCNM